MNYAFSPSNFNFYPYSLKDAYESSGAWPADAVDIEDSVFEEYSQCPPTGMSRGCINGMPAWVNLPPPTKEQLVAEAKAKQSSLLAQARISITPLQDAVDTEMATDEELVLLKSWKVYCVLLYRIDTSNPEQIAWPAPPKV